MPSLPAHYPVRPRRPLPRALRRAGRWLALALPLGWSSRTGLAQAVPAAPPYPPYQSERAKEDYRYLSENYTGPRDFFDPLKFILLSRSKATYLTIGGEIRSHYQRFTNPGWGEEPPDRGGYLLQRLMLSTDWHFGPHLRVFGELKSGLVAGLRGTPGGSDEDRLDLHQAFVDLAAGTDSTLRLTLRVGRQEMSYGSSRLISLRESPNVRQTFDGVRLLTQTPRLNLDGFVTRPTTTTFGVFDDRPNPDVWFWGLYGVRTLPKLAGGLDLYYLGLANRQARFAQGTGQERRHSVGTRWWGTPGAFGYNVEAVYQFGSFGPGRIRAGTLSSELSYTLKSAALTPELTLRTEYISGDRDPANPTLQTFNPLFPKGAYFGQVALVGPVNLYDIHPLLALHPATVPHLTVTLDWVAFWRASRADGLYSVPYVLARPGGPAQSAYIGDQRTVQAEWDAQRHLKLELFLTYFRAGAFLRESGPGRDLTYASTRVTFLF